VFHVGSVSKLLCATGVAMLVERGELSLDAPLQETFRGLRLADPEVAERVTLRHLLLHRGGWTGDFYDDFGDDEGALGRYVEELVHLPQLVPLDSAFSYSNSGFGLLGHFLGQRLELSFEQAVEGLILRPLGLRDSGYPSAGNSPKGLFRSAHPGGGFRSTVSDLLRVARYHLLTAPHWLQQPGGGAGQLADAMAPGWMIDFFQKTPVLRLGGKVAGQAGLLALVPSRGFAFAGVGNDLGGLGRAMGTLLRKVLDLVQVHPPSYRAAEDSLSPYLGSYRAAMDAYSLRSEGGNLVMQRHPLGGYPVPSAPRTPSHEPAVLEFVEEDVVRSTTGPSRGMRGDFLRDDRGNVAWFRWEGRLAPRD